MEPKYPHVRVKLVGENGNALNLIGIVKRALHKAQVPLEDILAFQTEALSGNYDHVLQTIMQTVEVE